MQIINLYRYERPNGGVTVSPVMPECECTKMVRLVADEGKELFNGEQRTSCIDTESAEGWVEVDMPIEEEGD